MIKRDNTTLDSKSHQRTYLEQLLLLHLRTQNACDSLISELEEAQKAIWHRAFLSSYRRKTAPMLFTASVGAESQCRAQSRNLTEKNTCTPHRSTNCTSSRVETLDASCIEKLNNRIQTLQGTLSSIEIRILECEAETSMDSALKISFLSEVMVLDESHDSSTFAGAIADEAMSLIAHLRATEQHCR